MVAILSKADWEQLRQKRIQAAQSVVQFPGQFLDERRTFEAVTERPNDPVREVAKAV
jgi:hypothetical protein